MQLKKITLAEIRNFLKEDEDKVFRVSRKFELDKGFKRCYYSSQKYRDLINGLITLEDKKVTIDNNKAVILYKQGKAFVDFSGYPTAIQELIIQILKPFEI